MNLPDSNQPSPRLQSGLPIAMLIFGGLLMIAGLIGSLWRNHGTEFMLSWLLAFMFYYSVILGALFFVILAHLTNAGWSVGIRRFCEHLAGLIFPWMTILFLPIGIFGKSLYHWMSLSSANNNLMAAKQPVFTIPGFWVTSAVFFLILSFLALRLRNLSLKQDAAENAATVVDCTRKMRFHSGWGIVAFALTLTFSGVLWMQATSYQFFSAMYGVYYFSSSTWAGLAFIYVISVAMLRQGILTPVLKQNYFYFVGVLLLGFTLLSAYTEFAQYFVVWNANMPEETFWYLIRENGNWWCLSMLLIVGKVFIPFFALLPVHTKTNFKVLVPICVLIAVMHFGDLAFNILPSQPVGSHHTKWIFLHVGTVLFMGGLLGKAFINNFNAYMPYPQRDPHLLEAMGLSQHEVSDLVDANIGGAK